MKTFEAAVLAATEEKDGKVRVKWPLECGCQSLHYFAKCGAHQAEEIADQGRLMGVADLTFPASEFWTDQGRDAILAEVRKHLLARPTKKLIIHLRAS